MIRKKDIYDKIVHELSIFVSDIESKAEKNLLDDNVFSEDFIKDLLNTCLGWNLINLNTDTSKFPGIDLGDKERRIGVQVTSTKTSKKVLDSLDTIISNNVDEDYDEIYFFILGKKQRSYSVDFFQYDTLDCSESNIWDVADVIAWCAHYDAKHMEQVWNIIKREIVLADEKSDISIEIRKSILELKKAVDKVFEASNQLIQTHYTSVEYRDEVGKSLCELDNMLPYFDESTYITCKEVLETALELGEVLKGSKKWQWKTQMLCIRIMDNILIERNLREVSELISSNIPGLQKRMDIVIDGNDLFERLIKLKIDEDILYKQFSMIKFQRIIEKIILRDSKKCIVVFSKDNSHFNAKVIERLEAEGTQVTIFEDRKQVIAFMCEQIKRNFELLLVSSSDDLIKKVLKEKDECYLYTVSFENDLPARFVPVFFSRGDVTSIRLNYCFDYNECKVVNIRNINEEIYKDMLANANDCISHQVRVDWSGDVYISTITGAEEIDDVKFRWESWDSGNGYAGPRAASDYKYVKKSVASLKKCWEDGVQGYCDDYAIL